MPLYLYPNQTTPLIVDNIADWHLTHYIVIRLRPLSLLPATATEPLLANLEWYRVLQLKLAR